MQKRVLITGGTGFLGGHVAKKLTELNYDVVITGRDSVKAASILNSSDNLIRFEKLDITDNKSVLNSLDNFQYVIHCAGLASPWGQFEKFRQANIIGTQNIVQSCLKNKVHRLVNISTPSIYFDYKDKINIKESDPLPTKQVSFYGESKLQADRIITNAFRDHNLQVVSIRPRAIFGPGDKTITPRLIGTKIFGRTPLINGGKAFHDFTYVENVVDAIVLCLGSGKHTIGNFYNITNDEPLPLAQIYEKFLKAHNQEVNFINVPYNLLSPFVRSNCFIKRAFSIEKEPRITTYGLGLLTYSQILDISASKKDLGYSPKFTIDEALKKMI